MNKDPQALGDWLQTHRELMQLEASFTALAMKAAEGEYPESSSQSSVLARSTLTFTRPAHMRWPKGTCNAREGWIPGLFQGIGSFRYANRAKVDPQNAPKVRKIVRSR